MNKILISILAISLFSAVSCSAVTTKEATEKITGKIIAVSMTSLELQNKTVVSIDKNTKIKKSGKDASISDITIGTSVTVSGTLNEKEKTIVAKTITINVPKTAAAKTTVAKATAEPKKAITKYDFGASVSEGIFKAFGSMFGFINSLISK